ncbi:MAG: hypothetical protein LBC64_05010 [Fibromonadaceae bacterium]|jgi:hypothetical protein|nr:hypothetical protein [Fibromonadaceae bacterium]
MKTQLAKLALTAALGLAITFTLNACGKGGDVKLLESITDESGGLISKFEYDKQNRIVKKYNYYEKKLNYTETITYADNIVTIEEVYESGSKNTRKFVINGNTVTIEGGSTFTINKDGYFVRLEYDKGFKTYKYRDDGNPIGREEEYTSDGITIASYANMDKYDDKKSPFYNCNSPKWLLQHGLNVLSSFYEYGFISKNNVLEINVGGENDFTTVYKYEYDGDGFPVKMTAEQAYEDVGSDKIIKTITITRFTYRGETKKQDAADTKPSETASESQPSGGEKCSKEGPPITIEAVFLENREMDALDNSIFRLPSGEEITFNGSVSDEDNVKKCDKVSVTYKETEIYIGENYCADINRLVSLKKIGSGVKLLESITYDNGNAITKILYDEQNRIVKIDDKTITYADNLITVGAEKYVINGNTIIGWSDTLTVNKEGYIVRQGYEYKDGNLIKAGDSDDFDYNEYDDKKSPFSNTNTPKWLLQQLFYVLNPMNKNNVLKNYYDYGEEGVTFFRYEYEYDGDGFPIKRMEVYAPTISFTYLCGTKN